jgi:predicted enzyme related to lactoylglutathione lyase
MEKTSYDPGTPSWVDLGVPDVEAAAQFYGELFGWASDPGPEEAGGYRMCLLDGRPVAGLGLAQSPGTPFWSMYISVADADETRDRVLKAGGTVLVEPMETLGFGRFAVFTDPVGAQLSVWQPMLHPGAGRVNEPGTMCWHELLTEQPEAAAEFYGSVFGWGRGEGMIPGAPAVFTLGDGPVAGLFPQDPPDATDAAPARWLVYFLVADTEEASARVVELGGNVTTVATDSPAGRYAIVADPDGAIFGIVEPVEG